MKSCRMGGSLVADPIWCSYYDVYSESPAYVNRVLPSNYQQDWQTGRQSDIIAWIYSSVWSIYSAVSGLYNCEDGQHFLFICQIFLVRRQPDTDTCNSSESLIPRMMDFIPVQHNLCHMIIAHSSMLQTNLKSIFDFFQLVSKFQLFCCCKLVMFLCGC